MVAREEIWKDIEGGEGRYQVSNRGRVRSLPRMVERAGSSPYWMAGGIMSPYPNGHKGYQLVALKGIGKRYVHRLVAAAFLGPVNGMEVDHADADPGNNDVTNLQIVTSSENKRFWRERKPHCQRGHLYGPNDIASNGRRDCKTCAKIKRAERKASK